MRSGSYEEEQTWVWQFLTCQDLEMRECVHSLRLPFYNLLYPGSLHDLVASQHWQQPQVLDAVLLSAKPMLGMFANLYICTIPIWNQEKNFCQIKVWLSNFNLTISSFVCLGSIFLISFLDISTNWNGVKLANISTFFSLSILVWFKYEWTVLKSASELE